MNNEYLSTLVINKLKANKQSIAVAESCTGGLLSKYLTDVSGASSVFFYGAVTYNEDIKQKILGVKKETLEKFSVYSRAVAFEMADGVRKKAGTYYGVGITGVAGPGSDGEIPAGTIYICIVTPNKTLYIDLSNKFDNDIRNSNREAAVGATLEAILKELENGE